MVRNELSEGFRPDAAVPQLPGEGLMILFEEEGKQFQVLLKKHRNRTIAVAQSACLCTFSGTQVRRKNKTYAIYFLAYRLGATIRSEIRRKG